MNPHTEVIAQFVRQGDGSRSHAFNMPVMDLLAEIERQGMHHWPDAESGMDQFLILLLFTKDDDGDPVTSNFPLMATQNFYSVVYEKFGNEEEVTESE